MALVMPSPAPSPTGKRRSARHPPSSILDSSRPFSSPLSPINSLAQRVARCSGALTDLAEWATNGLDSPEMPSMTKRKPKKKTAVNAPSRKPAVLLAEVRELILQARDEVSRAVDSGLTTLYWHVGRRIRQDNDCRGQQKKWLVGRDTRCQFHLRLTRMRT
jgi:hypothetical protein